MHNNCESQAKSQVPAQRHAEYASSCNVAAHVSSGCTFITTFIQRGGDRVCFPTEHKHCTPPEEAVCLGVQLIQSVHVSQPRIGKPAQEAKHGSWHAGHKMQAY
jgi:hypothetical protein